MNRTFALPKPPRTSRLRRRVAASPAVASVDAAVTRAPALTPTDSAPLTSAEAPALTPTDTAPLTDAEATALTPFDTALLTSAEARWPAPTEVADPPTAAAPISTTVDWSRVDPSTIDWAAIDWAAADWSRGWPQAPGPQKQAPSRGGIPISVYAINEPLPGPRWQALFDATWPAYRAWYLKNGDAARPDLATATAMLALHMPELVPTYERLVALTGDDKVAARMLTMWDTPAFLPSCSQAVVTEPSPVLCRNYDYSPDLWEQTVYSSAFTGRKVIGTGDCLWGLLDGMNDAGLVVSLTFGGRPGSGLGFAIPLVVRYLLEVAETAEQARDLLMGLPVAMSYNLTVVDASGSGFTAFVAPDAEPEFFDEMLATNHRGSVPEFSERANSLRSVPRQERLTELVVTKPSPNELAAAFLEAPLYNTEYARAFGTLYTAVYQPALGVVDYHWPDQAWRRTFDDASATLDIVLSGNQDQLRVTQES